MHPLAILQLLFLLMLANGTPVIAKKLLGERWAWPLDGGWHFIDGRPLFGPSKTVRGVVLAELVTIAGTPCIGLDWRVGAVVGGAAMAGDLFSSFAKRRLGIETSGMAPGLDQVPEALFPLLACAGSMPLGMADIAAGVVLFVAGEVVLSRLLYRLHLRDRPY
jgi:hypothetical protein